MTDSPTNDANEVVPAETAALVPSESRDENAETEDRYVFTPAIDIYENDEGLVLRADLPGVASDSLDLQVQDNKLTLFGRVAAEAPEGAKPVHREYPVGDFLRSFILSDDVDHERITAKLTNGVLWVTLPRASRGEPRRIRVDSH